MKIKKENLLYYIALFLMTNNILYDIAAIKYIRAVLLLLLCAYYSKKKKHDLRENIDIALFLLVELLSTVINHRDIVSCVGSILVVVLTVSMTLCQSSETMKSFLMCVYKYSVAFIALNEIVMFVAPNGLFSFSNGWGWTSYNYLCGQTLNLFLLLIIPFLVGNILRFKYGIVKCHTINIKIYVCAIFLYLVWIPKSETTAGVICIVLAVSQLCFRQRVGKKKIQLKFSARFMFLLMIFMTSGIVFSNFLLSNIVVKFFIESVLHKTINFTGRTEIWSKAINSFIKKPLIGYGVGAQVVHYIDGILVNEHNQFLHILIEGGLVAFGGFLFIVIRYINTTAKIREDRINNVLVIAFLCAYLFFFTAAFGMAASWEFYFMAVLVRVMERKENYSI